MINSLVGIYGASGFGSEVLPLARYQFPQSTFAFVDDSNKVEKFLNEDVLSFQNFCDITSKDRQIIIAIAHSKTRELLHSKVEEHKINQPMIISSNSLILDPSNISLGPGCILCPFSMLTSNIKIGKSFHANIYSYVAHDCLIGDFVTFAPAVKCNGNVHIKDHAYIGTGAILKQGSPSKPLVIGEGAVIGMGAVVTKDVQDGETVIGNPARPMIKK